VNLPIKQIRGADVCLDRGYIALCLMDTPQGYFTRHLSEGQARTLAAMLLESADQQARAAATINDSE